MAKLTQFRNWLDSHSETILDLFWLVMTAYWVICAIGEGSRIGVLLAFFLLLTYSIDAKLYRAMSALCDRAIKLADDSYNLAAQSIRKATEAAK